MVWGAWPTCSVSVLVDVVVLSLAVVGVSLGITRTKGYGNDKQSVETLRYCILVFLLLLCKRS